MSYRYKYMFSKQIRLLTNNEHTQHFFSSATKDLVPQGSRDIDKNIKNYKNLSLI